MVLTSISTPVYTFGKRAWYDSLLQPEKIVNQIHSIPSDLNFCSVQKSLMRLRFHTSTERGWILRKIMRNFGQSQKGNSCISKMTFIVTDREEKELSFL